MRSLLAILIVLLCLPTLASAKDFLVREDGVYEIIKVFSFPPGSTVEGCDNDGDPPPPPSGTTTEQAKVISKMFLRNTFEAASVSLAVTSAAGSADPKTKLKSNLTIAGGDFPGNQFDKWFAQIELLSKTEQFSTVFLTAVNAGVVQAFSGEEAAEGAMDIFLILKIVTCVLQNIGEAGEELSALDFQKIMKIVMCIIGNLPPVEGSATFVPIPMPIPEEKPELQLPDILKRPGITVEVIKDQATVPTMAIPFLTQMHFTPATTARDFDRPSRDALWVKANRDRWMSHQLKSVLVELGKLPGSPNTFEQAGL